MKHKFNFLLLEFKDIFYIINKIWEEKDINIVNLKLIKLIKEIIIKAHLNNDIFYNPEKSLIQNMDVLYKRNIIPYDLLRYVINYIEELKHIKNLLEKDNLSKDKIDKYESLLKNEDFIYEISVWLVVSSGEENYSLFIDDLEVYEKLLFDKYIKFKNKFLYEEEDEFKDIPLDESDEIHLKDEFEDNELTAEENLITGELYYLGNGVEKDYKKAKIYFEKSAENENENAEGYLGLFYEKGYGGEKDIDKALYWYKKSALKGNLFSQYSLGYIYYEGRELERNLSYSFKWYKEAAEGGFAPAQYALSYLYKNGEGCDKNVFKAYYWLEESADNDFEDSYYILGQSYLEGKNIEINYKKAFFYLSKGAEKNDINCLESLGDMYYFGLYVNNDKEKALDIYKQSIEEGNIELYYKLGKIYEEGNDIKSALVSYYKGHGNGIISCTERLGVIYYNGNKVRKDEEKALELLEMAAKEGNEKALYFIGNECLKNNKKEEGIKYLLEGFRKGSYEATELLLEEGIKDFINGENIEEIKLVAYCNKLMDINKPSGSYYYGLLYYYGVYFEKSYEKAFINIIKAAEKEYKKAMNEISNWYKEGIYVNKNQEESIRWFNRANEIKE